MEVIDLTGSSSPKYDDEELTAEEWDFLIADMANTRTAQQQQRQQLFIHDADGEMLDVKPESPPPQLIPTYQEVLDQVLEIFPDVKLDHVLNLYYSQSFNTAEFIIGALAEAGSYPKEEPQNDRKRKRSDSRESKKDEEKGEEEEEEEDRGRYVKADRRAPTEEYVRACTQMLSNEFDQRHITWIRDTLKENRNFLYPAYKAMAKASDDQTIPRIRRRRAHYNAEINRNSTLKAELEAELSAAKADVEKIERKKRTEREAALAAKRKEEAEEAAGDVSECQCCFADYTFSKLTQCNDGHLFCIDCCRRYVENEVGEGKYKLTCMDCSGCKAGFSVAEIARFCEKKTLEALTRLEQADSLRIAGEEDPSLVNCPFCDFAAICEPVEVDRLFLCQNPPCMEISCRLCREKSHIPKTCEENKKENKLSLRRGVEEAMTEAMMRRCGKCNTPYVKESGCNKVPCSRCSTINCYICRKVITDYNHFNDVTRGGKAGQCPLFDQNTEQRHEEERLAAEKASIEKIRQENPDLSEDDLKVKLSAAIEQAEKQRHAAMYPPGFPVIPGVPVAPVVNLHQPFLYQHLPAVQRGAQVVANVLNRRRNRVPVAPPAPIPQMLGLQPMDFNWNQQPMNPAPPIGYPPMQAYPPIPVQQQQQLPQHKHANPYNNNWQPQQQQPQHLQQHVQHHYQHFQQQQFIPQHQNYQQQQNYPQQQFQQQQFQQQNYQQQFQQQNFQQQNFQQQNLQPVPQPIMQVQQPQQQQQQYYHHGRQHHQAPWGGYGG